MKTNPKEPCGLCNVKRRNMIELACGVSTCGKCIEKSLIESQSLKRYKCTNCSRNHNIKDEQVCKNVKEKLNKLKRKKRWVFGGTAEQAAELQQLARSRVRQTHNEDDDDNESDDSEMDQVDNNNNAAGTQPGNHEKRGFDYKNCSTKPIKTFNLNVVKNKGGEICQPILDNKILFSHENSLSIRDQDGNIIKTVDVIKIEDERIANMCLNDKYIYIAIQNYKKKKTTVKKLNHNLELLTGQQQFDTQCFSLTASNNRVFFNGVYGYEYNEHPIVYILDANSLKLINSINYEQEDEKTYCVDKLSDPPRSVVFGNRIYFCYENYNDEKFNQVDYADVNTLHYKGKLKMPEYFMHFQIDANGNFVYYHHQSKSFSVHDQNGKLIKRVKLDVDVSDCIDYCITNDGKLVVLKSSNDVQIF